MRGIAENDPTTVFYSDNVSLPKESLFPLADHKWELKTEKLTVEQVLKLSANFASAIPDPQSRSKVNCEFGGPSSIPVRITTWPVDNIDFFNDAGGFTVSFPIDEAKGRIKANNLEPNQLFQFRVHYVPKPHQKIVQRAKSLKKV